MAEFPAPILSPARVHDRARQYTGHYPCWIRRPYQGGFFSIEHFRICSYCECIHPGDAIELLEAGAWLEEGNRPRKYLLQTPNPIAGDLVRMGSIPGPIFSGSIEFFPPGRRLRAPARDGLLFEPSAAERMAGHFERPALEQAPALISWPLFSDHVSDRQWPEIWAAQGEHHAEDF
jgi:hypothetical protein